MSEIEKSDNLSNSSKESEDTSEEFLNELPEVTKRTIVRSFSQMMIRSVPDDPIVKKLTPQHIDSIIDLMKNDREKEHDISKRSIFSQRFYVCIGIALFVFLIVFLSKSDTDLLMDLIKILIPSGLAFLGGYGYGKTKK